MARHHTQKLGIFTSALLGIFTLALTNEAFDASYRGVSTQTVSKRKATAEQLAQCLPSASIRSDSTDGSLRLAGRHLDHYGGYGSRRYWSEILLEHRGSRVTVRFDPDHVESVRVYSMDGSFLCTAGRLRPAGFDDAEAAGMHAQARQAFMAKAERQAAAVLKQSDAAQSGKTEW